MTLLASALPAFSKSRLPPRVWDHSPAGLLRNGREQGPSAPGSRDSFWEVSSALWLQFLFNDDKMFSNSQPGVCKHLRPFKRVRPGGGDR